MTDQEILTKAIKKAIDCGWCRYRQDDVETIVDTIYKSSGAIMDGLYFWSGIIFNHDFAKALWGYGNDCEYCGTRMAFAHPHPCPFAALPMFTAKPLWQYHLQQMVMSEDPIKYLGENLA